MSEIKASTIRSRFQTVVRDTINWNIDWGTNRYPAHSLISWFGGTTSGISTLPSEASFKGTSQQINPALVRSALSSMAAQYARIRRVRIRIYKTYTSWGRRGNSHHGDVLQTDNTGIAHLTPSLSATYTAPAKGTFSGGEDATFSSVTQYIDRLRDNLLSARDGSILSLSATHCHSSCHQSCHSNRGRR